MHIESDETTFSFFYLRRWPLSQNYHAKAFRNVILHLLRWSIIARGQLIKELKYSAKSWIHRDLIINYGPPRIDIAASRSVSPRAKCSNFHCAASLNEEMHCSCSIVSKDGRKRSSEVKYDTVSSHEFRAMYHSQAELKITSRRTFRSWRRDID